MTKTKSTKRALLMSALSLLMCVSMLIGSTFAWFTDSVSSMNNIIKSGNLDVELEYYDGDSWEKVTADTNVFEKNTLWEPGHTEVVYLKVSNLGTLALKYNLGINVVSEIESINVDGKALRLSDYIEFGAVEGVTTPYADRAAARAAVTDAKVLSTGYTKAGNIEAGADAQYVALVVYMPETVGNEANYRTGEVAPEITLGLNLMATQYTSESDSFDNQYDANAKYDGVPAARVTTLAKMPVVTSATSGKTYTLDTAYVFNTTESYEAAQENTKRYWHADFVASFDKDVDSAAIGLAGQYDTYSADWLAFELDGMGTIAANTPVRMLEFAGITMNYEELCLLVEQFQCGAFAVDAAAMEGTTMTVELRIFETEGDPNTDSGSKNVETDEYITIGKYSYTFGGKKVSSVAELQAAATNGGNVVLAADLEVADDATIKVAAGKELTLDLNGHTISGVDNTTAAYGVITVNAGASLTINDSVGSGLITASATIDSGWSRRSCAVSNERGTVIVNGGTIEHTGGTSMSYAIDNLTNGKGTYAKTVVNGGNIKSSYIGIRQFCNGIEADNIVEINGGNITGAKRSVWMQDPSANANTGSLTINGGTFNGAVLVDSDNFVVTIADSYNVVETDAGKLLSAK